MVTRKSTRRKLSSARKNGLANTFRRLAVGAEQLEDTAKQILKVVNELDVRTFESFDRLVQEAYRQNGWNQRPGRPNDEAKAATAVPPVVRTYNSTVRAAFRLGLNVQRFESFYQLRRAIREKRKQLDVISARKTANGTALRGVKISSPTTLTGALFHDLIVVHNNLDAQSSAALERSLQRLFGKYRKLSVEMPEIHQSDKEVA